MEELKPDEQELLIQSYTACSHVEERESPVEKREAAAWNGYIVSESDSDNPDTYSGITNLSSFFGSKEKQENEHDSSKVSRYWENEAWVLTPGGVQECSLSMEISRSKKK